MLAVLSGVALLAGCTTHEEETTKKYQSGRQVEAGTTFNGFAQWADRVFESLTINGAAQLQRIVVHNNATVNGSLQGEGVEVHAMLTVNGACHLQNSAVKGLVRVNGVLRADRCNFADIDIVTSEMGLRDSKAQSIIVRAQSGTLHDEQQVVHLDNTIIAGSITFENGKGRVVLTNNAKITGQVIGGVVESK